MKQTTIRLACVAVLGFGTLVGFALASPASAGSVWVPNQQYVDCLHLMAFEARYNNGMLKPRRKAMLPINVACICATCGIPQVTWAPIRSDDPSL